MPSVQVIEVNGERWASVAELRQMVATLRECSKTRKEALEYIAKNINLLEAAELNGTIRVR
jgi:hypothetical protein